MLVLGDAGERRARLALAAGAQRQHLVRRQITVAFDAAEILHVLEITGLARDLDHALHGAADNDHFAVGGAGGVGDCAQPPDMGGESRDRDAAPRGADQFGQRLRDICFRWRLALAHRIGGIADQRQHALVAERLELGRVGRTADDRRLVDLPVAGVNDGADGSADRKRVRFRNRMRDIDEIDLERPERHMTANRHDIDRNFRHARLGRAPRLEQRGGERRRVERHFQLRPQIHDRAHVVLMGVGKDEAENVLALFDQERDVGQDQVDAGQMLFGGE